MVMACAGDVPTLEVLAAVSILRDHLPALNIRVVNVVNLMALQPNEVHPHGLSDAAFDALFEPPRVCRRPISPCHATISSVFRFA